MGISEGWLNQFVDRAKLDGFVAGDAILDIGAQEFFCVNDPAAINRFLEHFGAPPYSKADLERVANSGTYVAETFRRAGLIYAAIDIIRCPGVTQLDLEHDRLPWKHRRRYKYVNNSGTTEHVVNQLNAFKVIHDATAVGGVMYHGVPLADYQHGMVSYSPKFFWSLATANDYQVVQYFAWAAEQAEPIDAAFLQQITFNRPAGLQQIWHHIWLRRVNDAPFRGFHDPAFAAAFS
jgi:hypothetical protein